MQVRVALLMLVTFCYFCTGAGAELAGTPVQLFSNALCKNMERHSTQTVLHAATASPGRGTESFARLYAAAMTNTNKDQIYIRPQR